MIARIFRSLLLTLVASVTLAFSPAAPAAGYMDHEPSAEAMLVDGILVRPLALGATVVGAATWIVTLPFSLLGGNAGEAAEALVLDPAAFTFTRPLGEL